MLRPITAQDVPVPASRGWLRPGQQAASLDGSHDRDRFHLLQAAFIAVERRSPHPLLDLALFRRPSFSTVMAAGVLLTACAFAPTVYTQLWLQSVLNLPAIGAGLVLLPMAGVAFVVAAVARSFGTGDRHGGTVAGRRAGCSPRPVLPARTGPSSTLTWPRPVPDRGLRKILRNRIIRYRDIWTSAARAVGAARAAACDPRHAARARG